MITPFLRIENQENNQNGEFIEEKLNSTRFAMLFFQFLNQLIVFRTVQEIIN